MSLADLHDYTTYYTALIGALFCAFCLIPASTSQDSYAATHALNAGASLCIICSGFCLALQNITLLWIPICIIAAVSMACETHCLAQAGFVRDKAMERAGNGADE